MDSSKFDKQPDQHELAKMASRADGETEVLQHLGSQNTAIINGLIEEIGFGRYQWNLFVTCGFGFMLDQMLPVAVGLVIPQITKEWDTQYPEMIIAALYAGSLVGALLCGAMVDVVGRKLVWQSSLLFVTVFAMVSAGSPSFAAPCVFVGLQAVGAGGNFAIDLTVFIESLPKSKDYLLCALPLWWGIGSALGGFFAWPLITFYSCPEQSTPSTCTREENMGWRYQYILIGGISLVAALIRIFCLRMEESPKWLVTQGKFSEAVLVLEKMARQNKSSVVASVNDFHPMPQGEEGSTQTQSLLTNVAGLFKGRKQRYSTIGVIILWICIGVAYPVYTLYLPIFLENKGAMLGDGSTFQTYRDYSISSTVGIFGPILSTLLVNVPWLGRRRAMAVTAICAAAFCGGFTTVRNEAGNVAFSSMISFWQNAFYAILYSYTPEVMPTAYRGTGCGLTLAFGRIASLSAPFIATYGDLSTSVPIWVLVGVYGLIAMVAACLPFEPKHFKEEDRF